MANYDDVFGPRVDPSHRAFDFTLLFEDAILACLPTVVFLLILPLPLAFLFKKPNVVNRSNLLTAKVLTLLSLLACQVAFLTLRSVTGNVQTQASLAADVLKEYRALKDEEAGITPAAAVVKPVSKRPKYSTKPLTEHELQTQLAAHKALMSGAAASALAASNGPPNGGGIPG